MWNNCCRVSESTNSNLSSAVAKFEKIVKFSLLRTQKLYENNIWCLPNYDISEVHFQNTTENGCLSYNVLLGDTRSQDL